VGNEEGTMNCEICKVIQKLGLRKSAHELWLCTDKAMRRRRRRAASESICIDSEDAMTFAVPKPVATYLAAEAAKDTDVISRCFTEDGLIAGATRSANGKRRTRNATTFWLRSDFAQRQTR
jgi:hypothetical protein